MMADDRGTFEEALERERNPGRRHTRAELRVLKTALRKIYQYGNEREFMSFLRGIGLKDESPQFVELVALFRSLQRGRKP
jgi:hypothetical protein